MANKFRYAVEHGCTICGMCAPECPVVAIRVTPRGAVIDENKCIRCGKCYQNCASEAIVKIETDGE